MPRRPMKCTTFNTNWYCSSDVSLLREGMLCFRENFVKDSGAGVDPLQCVTIASACMRDYRGSPDFPLNKIGIIEHKHLALDITSMKAAAWFAYLNNPNIQHAHSSEGEAKPEGLNAKVDGYDATTKTVYQFHGCYFHGCKTCCPNDNKYNKTMDMNIKITLHGYAC
eukprot:Lithocolla_globosa_v1_NODE_115_length_6172_cov_14.462155.p4 type:complete len:167 gc:universal NODE_115_length_6172_cov_14.462155:4907-4407(-)